MYSNLGTYYNCSKGFNLTLEKGVMVKMTDVKVQAFMDDKSGKPSFGSTGMKLDVPDYLYTEHFLLPSDHRHAVG